MSRKRFTERDVLETIIINHIGFCCYRCKVPFEAHDEIQREHLSELAMGGEDTPINCAYSHKACHAIITNGTKATTAGSSKQRLAKVRRLRGENKPKFKRPWGKRKMASRPFQKKTRPMGFRAR